MSKMKLKKRNIFCLYLLLACFLGLTAFAGNGDKVIVEIEFGNKNQTNLKIETNWEKGLSALEALQFVADVETHPVGEYVFVTGINGVQGVPKKGVWYYEINGKPAKQLAISQPVKPGDVITWIYKQDVCSSAKK